jgi:hypothetical protein
MNWNFSEGETIKKTQVVQMYQIFKQDMDKMLLTYHDNNL